MSNPPEKQSRDWYSVSVTAVQQMLTVVGLVLAVIVGLVAFRWWNSYSVEREAKRVVASATELANQLKNHKEYVNLRKENRAAWELLEEAKVELEQKNYPKALDSGSESLGRLRRILEISDGGTQGTIRMLTVQGGVEFRRGERGAWRRARNQDSLNPGDWVKTSGSGTAEVLFPDGTVYTLRQNSMVHLGSQHGSDRSTQLVSGLVKLDAGQRGGRLSTPKSRATLRGGTTALVSFDQSRGRGSFGVYSGELEVESDSGQTQRIGRLQQVDQVGDNLSDVKELPGKPRLTNPGNGIEFDLDSTREIQLAWQPVQGVDGYALQIASSPLFASNIVDDPRRIKATARIGLEGEGSFFWQVAAIDGSLQGPWSDPGTFRVTTQRAVATNDDKTPPELAILSTQTYGPLVILNGRTEPGSVVTVNGESTSLKRDGTFSKTVQMDEAGWGFIEIESKDAWDNTAYERVRVFVDVI